MSTLAAERAVENLREAHAALALQALKHNSHFIAPDKYKSREHSPASNQLPRIARERINSPMNDEAKRPVSEELNEAIGHFAE